jgi:hypothetical protein
MRHYILEGREAVPVGLLRWARWFETAYRHIGQTESCNGFVSTVFLGLDHNFLGNGPPILFETLVFGGEWDGEMFRYSTFEEAVEGHYRVCNLVGPKLLTYQPIGG